MEALFLKAAAVSLKAGWVALAVCLIRRLLRRAPKWLTVALWGLVAFRLVIPVSMTSPISAVPQFTMSAPMTALKSDAPSVYTQQAAPAAVVHRTTAVYYLARLWPVGTATMWGYFALSCLRLKKRVETATMLSKGVYQSEYISSPFILGIIKPKVFIPYGISDDDLPHVLAHEGAHLSRGDHLIKPFAFLLLSVYWFNPALWLAYALLCRDVEMACDEKAVVPLDEGGRRAYSLTLLNLGVSRGIISVCPLSFGEPAVKERIIRMKNYKKPTFLLICTAILVCFAAAVSLLTDRAEAVKPLTEQQAVDALIDSVTVSDGLVKFTVPDYAYPEKWNILVAGRTVTGDFSRSIHFFEDINSSHGWQANKLYSTEAAWLTELCIEASITTDGGTATASATLLTEDSIEPLEPAGSETSGLYEYADDICILPLAEQ